MKKTIFLLLPVIFICSIALYIFFQKDQQKMGTVIVLNGPSGSGKSSIQKEFQYLMIFLNILVN